MTGTRRGDRRRPRRPGHGALAAVAGVRADDLRAELTTLGGQWTGLDGISGVWPTMHTNTSRILTSFSDLEHDNDLTFPSNRDILAYLHRYAETFALTSRIRFGTRVDLLSRGDGGWLVEHSGTTEAFERVVVASGRFQSPYMPTVPGTRDVHRPGRGDVHIPTTASPIPISASAFSSRAAPSAHSKSPPSSRNSARPVRGHSAAPTVRAAEVRRGRAVRFADLHAVRNLGERDPPASRDRPTAQGDRRRGRWQPGAVRRARARSVAVRRRRHPRPAVPAAGRGGPNHGAAVADIGRRHRR